ncbi:MAG TPA: YbaY family lipoprotein, partial [Candidatus Limnocylindrales bacterium]
MSRARIRLFLAVALVSLNLFVLAGPLHAAGDTVSGNLLMLQKIALSPDAVAVITLTDRSKDGAGTIIGQQRIDGATGNDAFSVQFDPTVINQKHAYSIYASVVDGDKQYQNLAPVPVITGGPVDGLTVQLDTPDYQTPAQITGTIALPNGVTASATAVAYAAILDATTGRL